MTDILIRMEMPKNCMVCDFRNRGFDLNGDLFCNCRLTKENVPDYYNIRMENCPLVELPEHGDLIDRDALFKQMGVTDMDCYKCEFGNHGFCGRGEFSAACEAIEDAPVIVPANKEESE